MRIASASFGAVLAVFALSAQALPASTQAQKDQVENCKILSGAVFQFAEARDKKQSKMDAFKNVTHGQNYVPGSLLDETLQWAYAHPDEQPDTASGHFYDRCVLDAYDARNPDTEGALDIAAVACQQGHAGAPDAIRDCIDDKTQDLIANPQSALALSGSPAATAVAPAAATVVAAAPVPSPATVVAAATASPPATSEPILLPAPAVETPAPVTGSHAVASAAVASVTAPAPPLPRTEVTAAAPAVSTPQPVVAAAQSQQTPLQGVLPLTPPPTVAAPAVSVPEAVVAEAHAQAPQAVTPVNAPPLPAPVTPPPLPPAPVPAKAASPAPIVAQATTPQSIVPAAALPPSRSATAAGFPANLAGFGKLSVGMPMEDAYKALQSHGDTDYDADGEVHTYMIGEDHGFMELRPSATGTLYSIRVVGGADAHQAPILSVTLGDAAFILINAVGLPSSRTPLPGDKELWNYRDRNYAFEISPGGDVIGVRIIDTSYAPAAATGSATP